MSGVVQGRVLGPFTVFAFSNDITNLFDDRIVCKLHADDVHL